jgi:hypothetical protein
MAKLTVFALVVAVVAIGFYVIEPLAGPSDFVECSDKANCMRAATFRGRRGGIESIVLSSVAKPIPSAGFLRIKVSFASLNPWDYYGLDIFFLVRFQNK